MTSQPRGGRPLHEIETWVFDLDNTLYPAACNLFVLIEKRMNEFIAEEFKVGLEEAHEIRRSYFLKHGTTLRGLMLDNGMHPKRFLDYVHEVDLSSIPANPALAQALDDLPGRKIVFTNGSQRHAERILDWLSISHHFSGIFDIVACDYIPKPDPSGYETLIRRHDFDPRAAVMVEDIAKNLKPAAALGMTTAWIKGVRDWQVADLQEDHIHHVVEDLVPWLVAAPKKSAN